MVVCVDHAVDLPTVLRIEFFSLLFAHLGKDIHSLISLVDENVLKRHMLNVRVFHVKPQFDIDSLRSQLVVTILGVTLNNVDSTFIA